MKAASPSAEVKEPRRRPAAVNGASVSVTALPLARRQRRPGYIALLLVLVVGLAAVGGWLYSTAGQKLAVVVVVKDIPVGQVIERSDLSTVEVAGEVTAIAGQNLTTVLGQGAAVELLPGTLLQRAMVASGPVLAAGQAQVGIVLKGGQLPADGVSPGDLVQVLRLPGQAAANAAVPTGGADGAVIGGATPMVLTTATVFAAKSDPAQTGGWLVTVTVPATSAAAVAGASGAGLAALVQVSS